MTGTVTGTVTGAMSGAMSGTVTGAVRSTRPATRQTTPMSIHRATAKSGDPRLQFRNLRGPTRRTPISSPDAPRLNSLSTEF